MIDPKLRAMAAAGGRVGTAMNPSDGNGGCHAGGSWNSRTVTARSFSGGGGGVGSASGFSFAPAQQRELRSFHADAKHAGQPEHCTDLIGEITESFLEREKAAVKRFNEGTAAHNNNVSSLYSYFPSPHCLQYQPEVNEKMRMILIDWLIDVHLKFKLHPETNFLAVNLIDRYLSCVNTKHASGSGTTAGTASMSAPSVAGAGASAEKDFNASSFVPRSQLQLVGVSAILLAAKYEEIWPPEVRECVHISANTYTREEIIKMERSICTALSFRLTVPTSYPFAMRLVTVLDGEDFLGFTESSDPSKLREYESEERRSFYLQQLRHAVGFFLEHAMLDYKCLQFTPSQVANASVFLALSTLRLKYNGAVEANRENAAPSSASVSPSGYAGKVWSDLLQHYSRSELRDFRGCAEVILEFVSYVPTTKYQAVRRKYNSSRYGEISKMMMPNELPNQ